MIGQMLDLFVSNNVRQTEREFNGQALEMGCVVVWIKALRVRVGLIEAARILCDEGFEVFPYTTEDLVVAEKLIRVGCEVLMPWGSPIGSGRGLNNPFGLRTLRAYFPEVPIVVDAGIGLPSHAAQAMEIGCDAVLLNTAVAKAGDPVAMAKAFADAVSAGHAAFHANPIEMSDMATPSTPVIGKAFLT